MTQRDPLSSAAITRLQKEFARLNSLTTFQRVNERAADTKADKWLAYKPLTLDQLYDEPDERDMVTLVVRRPNGDIGSIGRSSFALHADDTYSYGIHLRIVQRPTEIRAILHALGILTLDSDFVVIRQEGDKQMRYCILCESHHETIFFVESKRYLNGLSYACQRSLRERKVGLRRMAS